MKIKSPCQGMNQKSPDVSGTVTLEAGGGGGWFGQEEPPPGPPPGASKLLRDARTGRSQGPGGKRGQRGPLVIVPQAVTSGFGVGESHTRPPRRAPLSDKGLGQPGRGAWVSSWVPRPARARACVLNRKES